MTHLLIVDDEKDIVDICQTYFEYEGYQVTTTTCGKEALKLLSSDIDIMILDIMMPEVNGYDIVKKMKDMQLVLNPKIPLVNFFSLIPEQLRRNGFIILRLTASIEIGISIFSRRFKPLVSCTSQVWSEKGKELQRQKHFFPAIISNILF